MPAVYTGCKKAELAAHLPLGSSLFESIPLGLIEFDGPVVRAVPRALNFLGLNQHRHELSAKVENPKPVRSGRSLLCASVRFNRHDIRECRFQTQKHRFHHSFFLHPKAKRASYADSLESRLILEVEELLDKIVRVVRSLTNS